MSAIVKNIAVVGAAGSLGSAVLERLIASGKFNIKALKRVGSKSAIPAGVEAVEVDFSSLDSLKAALAGQDAVVSTIGQEGIPDQVLLIDAAAAAGVKRFLPSEFGSDAANPTAHALPVYVPKVKVHDHLIDVSKKTELTWTSVYNNAFLDWGLQRQFILKTADSKPTLFDGGDLPFSSTTLATVGDAVVGVLTHPEETKNRGVYVQDTVVTQNKLLALVKKAAPEKVFEPVTVKIEDLVANANKRLSEGIFDFETFFPYLIQAVMQPGYGGKFEKTDNELFGIKEKTEEEIFEIVKKAIQ